MTGKPYWVYRIYGDERISIYTGITDDPHRRFGQHSNAVWADRYRDHTLTRYPAQAEARKAELAAIRTEHPVFNEKDAICHCGRGCNAGPPPPPVRVTLNIPPDLYRQLRKWTDAAADEIGAHQVSQQDALRAMLTTVIQDPFIGATVIDLLRRDQP